MITAQPGHKLRALQAGAKDFISKPFDLAEVMTRVHNMLEVRLLHAEIRRRNGELKKLFDEVVPERKMWERLGPLLPADSIAAPLMGRPRTRPVMSLHRRQLGDVTVLIADVVGFAELSPAVPAEPD